MEGEATLEENATLLGSPPRRRRPRRAHTRTRKRTRPPKKGFSFIPIIISRIYIQVFAPWHIYKYTFSDTEITDSTV